MGSAELYLRFKQKDINMSDQFNKIRETALAKIFADFDVKLEETIENFNESDIRDEDIEVVRGKYRNAFQNFFTTGFDTVFQEDFLDKVGAEGGGISQKDNDKDQMNLSVTDEDLQKLDNANSRNAFYRKIYPAKCSLLLERALKVQLEATSKLRTNVVAVECIENNTEASNTESDKSILELNQESCFLLANIKENIDRLHRLEAAQKII